MVVEPLVMLEAPGYAASPLSGPKAAPGAYSERIIRRAISASIWRSAST